MASILEGLFAGRAGIQAHGSAMSVLADNIANSNTTGYKSSRPDFATLLAGNLSGGGSATTVGAGSELKRVTEIFNQGTFEVTGRGLDVGIEGNGFFVVQDVGNTGQRFFTRAGNFRVDKDGYLIDQNGYNVMGFPASGTGSIEALNVNEIDLSSVATTAVTVGGNLNASSDTVALPAAGSTFAELQDAADYSTTATIYDGLGSPHDASIYFFHTDVGEWTIQVFVDGADIDGGTAGEPEQLGTDLVMNFDGNGAIDVGSDTNFDATGIVWANGASATDINFAFDNFVQFASASSVDTITQNGTGGGSVVSFAVEADGTLFAQLSNGETASIGTMALATFRSPEGLRRQGGSLYLTSTQSGQAVIGRPGSGTFGSLIGGSLELSNADMASDFVKLISIQRGFQGSSRIISNINDLLNEIINLA